MNAATAPFRLRPTDSPWEQFPDPHGRPTTPVRILHTGVPFVLEADFPPGFRAGLHWHPHDTLYVITAGALQFGDEGWFRPGDVRWVRGGHSYGPELAGPEGVRFHLVSLGGPIGLNWSDLYAVPDALAARLAGFERTAGRLDVAGTPLRQGASRAAEQRIATLAHEHPFAARVVLTPGAPVPARIAAGGTLTYVRGGTLVGDGESYAADDFRLQVCGPGAAPDAHRLDAGPGGADLLVFGLGSPAFA